MNEEIKQTMRTLRKNMTTYLSMVNTYEDAEGDTKDSLGRALDDQLATCIRIVDELMTLIHEALLTLEVADEPVNA